MTVASATSTTDGLVREDVRHASDARHEGHLRTSRRGVGARGEVGRRAGADRGARRAAADVQPQRQRDHGRLAGAQHVASRRSGPAGRRRGDRPQRARSAGLPGPPGPHARPQRADRTQARGHRPRDVHDLRPAPPRRRGPHRTPVGGAPRPPRRSRAGVGLAGAGGVRRRADALRRHLGPGTRGRGQQASLVEVPVRPSHRLLAQARAPAQRVLRGRGLAAAGGLGGRQPGRACWWGS